MNVAQNDAAEATIVYTTTTNGVAITEEKIFKGTQEEVKAQLLAFESTTVNNNDSDIDIKIEKVDIRK
jgi:K(+)-stimulated pyrophosphate-energized sodium pump